MRIPLLLATLASCARPAASFATMPSDAIPADDLIEALVELALTNCTGDERASHTLGVETAAAAKVKEGDENSDGMITARELQEMIRSAEEEVGDAADSVIATLQSGECVVGRMLEETSAETSGNGRMLAASRRRQRRSLNGGHSSAVGGTIRYDKLMGLLLRRLEMICERLVFDLDLRHLPVDLWRLC